jgi:hypothetical protein
MQNSLTGHVSSQVREQILEAGQRAVLAPPLDER